MLFSGAGISDIRNDHDANCTYEGDNNVLVQQTSNWLVALWASRDRPETFSTPLSSVAFMAHHNQILRTKWTVGSLSELTDLQGANSTVPCYKRISVRK